MKVLSTPANFLANIGAKVTRVLDAFVRLPLKLVEIALAGPAAKPPKPAIWKDGEFTPHEGEHYQFKVYIEGTTGPDGGLGTIRFPTEAELHRSGFKNGETISFERARQFVFGAPVPREQEQQERAALNWIKKLPAGSRARTEAIKSYFPKSLESLPYVLMEKGQRLPVAAWLMQELGLTQGQTVTREQAIVILMRQLRFKSPDDMLRKPTE